MLLTLLKFIKFNIIALLLGFAINRNVVRHATANARQSVFFEKYPQKC